MDGVGANHVRPGKDANVHRDDGKWKMDDYDLVVLTIAASSLINSLPAGWSSS